MEERSGLSVEIGKQSELSVEIGKQSELSVEIGKQSEPSVEIGKQSEPSVTIANKIVGAIVRAGSTAVEEKDLGEEKKPKVIINVSQIKDEILAREPESAIDLTEIPHKGLTLNVATLSCKINISMRIDELGPKFKATGPILAVRSNFGRDFAPGHEKAINTTKKSSKKPRKQIGTGDSMNSCAEFSLYKAKKKYYKIKLFNNGVIQFYGYDSEDLTSAQKLLSDLLTYLTAYLPIPQRVEFEIEFKMKNYNMVLTDSKNYFLNLEKVYMILDKIQNEEKKIKGKRYFRLGRPYIKNIRYVIGDSALLIGFNISLLDKKKKLPKHISVKITTRAKVLFLGTKHGKYQHYTTEIYDFLINILKDKRLYFAKTPTDEEVGYDPDKSDLGCIGDTLDYYERI